MKHRVSALAALSIAASYAAVAYAATFPADPSWFPLTRAGQGIADPFDDGRGNGREITGDASHPAAYVYDDGTSFFVRLRLDVTPEVSPGNLRPYGWGLLLDTDGDLSAYELSLMVDGTANTIQLARNTSPTNVGDPSDPAETLLDDWPWDPAANGNGRVTPADTAFDTTDDYFLDFAVPAQALLDAGITSGQSLVVWAGTSNDARSLGVDIVEGAALPGPGVLSTTAADAFSLDDLTGGGEGGAGGTGGTGGSGATGGTGGAGATGGSGGTGATGATGGTGGTGATGATGGAGAAAGNPAAPEGHTWAEGAWACSVSRDRASSPRAAWLVLASGVLAFARGRRRSTRRQ